MTLENYFYSYLVSVNILVSAHTLADIWRLEENLKCELFSLYHVGTVDQTQVFSLCL